MQYSLRSHGRPVLFVLFWLTLVIAVPARAQDTEHDICIYGGSSAGIVAGIQALKMGKSVVVVEPTGRIGGLSTGGLGATDIGNKQAIGGLSREFYERLAQHYGQTGTQWTFEPSAALKVYQDWITETGLQIVYNERLNRGAGVLVEDGRIVSITMESGRVFTAKMFLDCTYEGDLMAAAGVSYTIGREANSQYNETLNGVQTARAIYHQFVDGVDPYRIAGDSTSGLLPFIDPEGPGTEGAGDAKVQAYCFRMCLTNNPENCIPFAKPEGYVEEWYELLLRNYEAGETGMPWINSRMPNQKTDTNNRLGFSTDFVGQNYNWPEGSYAERDAIKARHLLYQKGLMWTLANHPRMLASVRNEVSNWGMCRDEFVDGGGWQEQLYIREARRMVGAFVMTQNHCQQALPVVGSIGMGAYTMDSHHVQRYLDANGNVKNEGDVQVGGFPPYPIGYGSIVPKASECKNLLVPVCLSSSHMAFGSIRMEPVFMVLAQSAATAASFAIDDDLSIQDVPYTKLSLQLQADQQVLNLSGNIELPEGAMIADESDPSSIVLGSWNNSSATGGFIGASYLHDGDAGKGSMSVTLTPDLPAAGDYEVFLRWTSHPNRASNVPITITHGTGTESLTVDQRENGGTWFSLGVHTFAEGTGGSLMISTTGTDGFVIADAAAWVTGEQAGGRNTVCVISTDGSATEGKSLDPARITIGRTGSLEAPLTVTLEITGSATQGDDYPLIPTTLNFAPGEGAQTLVILPQDDKTPEGDETLIVTVLPSAAYHLGNESSAQVTIADSPLDAWRHSNFTETQLADLTISGSLADPDGDGNNNLAEFFANSLPMQADLGIWNELTGEPPFLLEVRRNPAAADLQFQIQTSKTLEVWTPLNPTPPFLLTRNAGFDSLRFSLSQIDESMQFWRIEVSEFGFLSSEGLAFYSFDTTPDGLGTGDLAATSLAGFVSPPTISQLGSVIGGAGRGGASSYFGPDGIDWLGAGSAATPGHSLGWNPGSTENALSITLPMTSRENLSVRFDIRSAQAAGGSAPSAFSSVTYDLGDGAVTISGVQLSFLANNQFQEWSVDLSSIDEIDNQPEVTLTWNFADLSISPAESVRIDNLLIRSF